MQQVDINLLTIVSHCEAMETAGFTCDDVFSPENQDAALARARWRINQVLV